MIIEKFKSQFLNRKIVFIGDLFLSILSSIAILLVVNVLSQRTLISGQFFIYYIIASMLITVPLLYWTEGYKIIIRHFSIKDIAPFVLLSLAKSLALLGIMPIISGWSLILPFIILFDMLITLSFMIAARVILVIIYDYILNNQRIKGKIQQVLIYGISDKSVAAAIRLQTSPHYKVVGFITREELPKGALIERLPVYCLSERNTLSRILKDTAATAILYAKEVEAQQEESDLIDQSNKANVKTLFIPSVGEMIEGESFIHPREIKVEDLLGRPEIELDMELIETNFKGKVVMVTGAAGSIGSELVRQLATFGVKRLILFDNAETPMHNLRLELEDKFKELEFVPVIGDVRQKPRLDFAFKKYRPQVVFHAAAYKHVPLMEENPCEAVLVNVIGSRQVADKCIEYDVEKMVMISTDKAVNPTNVMGCTKRLAEIYVQSLGLALESGQKKGKTVFVTTRFGNVLGSNGSVIPRFRAQIASGGPLTVTHPEINRFFMTIPEACRLVMEAATMASATQIFVFDMGQPVKIDTLARRMISLAGFTPDVDIKIEYTGLRPGEKLYEEVLSNAETTLPTPHERIRIATVREYDYSDALQVVEILETQSHDVQIPSVISLMRDTVPEYHPSKLE